MTVRRTIRIKAFQALFQLNHNYKTTNEEAIKFAINHSLELEDDEFDEIGELEALKASLPMDTPSDQIAVDSLAYLKELVSGVQTEKEFLDEEIDNNLQNWSIRRIEITTLLILRIAVYELYFHEEIDPSIVMNEAIELTKSFNNEEASKFVNGVLQGVLDGKEA
ncbi:MAG: transcription antitermination factor NusB [Atopostipes sp.]|nr:transcription antitermination factor NusB [Atopostipes sp.]